MKNFKRLFAYFILEWQRFLLGSILSIISAGLSIIAPIIASQLIDYISQQVSSQQAVDIGYVMMYFGQYLIVILFSVLFGYSSYLILSWASNQIGKVMRDEAHNHMQKLPIAYFDDKPAGKISARIVNDTEVIRENFFQNFSTQILINFIYILGIYIALYQVNSTIGLWLLVLVPLLVGWQLIYTRLVKPINAQWRESVSDLNSQTAEIVQGVSIVQLFHQQEAMMDNFGKTNTLWQETRDKQISVESFLTWNLSELLKNTVLFLILTYMGTRYVDGFLGISVGTIYILINYVTRLFDPITMIVRLITFLQQAIAAADRVFELMDHPVEEDSNKMLKISAGEVSFNHVTFGYKETIMVLKDINLHATSGQTIALVGHTGSGKSSLINLLFRFYDPQTGQILIDNQNIRECNRESIRSDMGIVLQDPYLFTGTIASNVSMNAPDITEDMVYDALLKVGAQPLLDKLPLGIHEPVVEKGQSLSSGERQLISFARTLASNPRILILDEATSHIDTETEEVIQHAMKVVKEGRTTFIVAHRLSTIHNADQILLLENGEIVERGTHDELLNLDGKYAEMFQMQSVIAQ